MPAIESAKWNEGASDTGALFSCFILLVVWLGKPFASLVFEVQIPPQETFPVWIRKASVDIQVGFEVSEEGLQPIG